MQSILNTIKYAIIEVPFGVIIALVLAVFLNRKLKGTSYYEVYLTCSKSGDTKNLTGNIGICKIFVAVSKCTSTCCGTHDCRCDKNGNNCKQCPDTCTSAKCCGYELKALG